MLRLENGAVAALCWWSCVNCRQTFKWEGLWCVTGYRFICSKSKLTVTYLLLGHHPCIGTTGPLLLCSYLECLGRPLGVQLRAWRWRHDGQAQTRQQGQVEGSRGGGNHLQGVHSLWWNSPRATALSQHGVWQETKVRTLGFILNLVNVTLNVLFRPVCCFGDKVLDVLIQFSHDHVCELFAGLVKAKPSSGVHQAAQLLQLLCGQSTQIQLPNKSFNQRLIQQKTWDPWHWISPSSPCSHQEYHQQGRQWGPDCLRDLESRGGWWCHLWGRCRWWSCWR